MSCDTNCSKVTCSVSQAFNGCPWIASSAFNNDSVLVAASWPNEPVNNTDVNTHTVLTLVFSTVPGVCMWLCNFLLVLITGMN